MIRVIPDEGDPRDHLVSPSKHLQVHTGDRVRAGSRLIDGPLPPQEILKIQGAEALENYLVAEVQRVYRAQGVIINDKHMEVIIMQMMRKVQIQDPGGSTLLPNALVDKHHFRRIAEQMVREGKEPPSATPMIMGITKASVQSESFISAASFQETTKVLTEAALRGKLDPLHGLKENVILGNLIPAGTGSRRLLHTRVKKKVDFSQFADPSEGFEQAPGVEALQEDA